MAAHGSSEPLTVRTASAVEFAATISACGAWARSQCWHWAVACGCDSTRVSSAGARVRRELR